MKCRQGVRSESARRALRRHRERLLRVSEVPWTPTPLPENGSPQQGWPLPSRQQDHSGFCSWGHEGGKNYKRPIGSTSNDQTLPKVRQPAEWPRSRLREFVKSSRALSILGGMRGSALFSAFAPLARPRSRAKSASARTCLPSSAESPRPQPTQNVGSSNAIT